MNAQLREITVMPIQRPTYCNTSMDYARWLENNLQTLTDYWNSLITADGAGPINEDDFFVFTLVQHECEQDRMDELRRCYGSGEKR